MLSNLFRSLAGHPAGSGDPLPAALLYSFCPAAARWWQAGAVPVPAFDPLWSVIEHRSSGMTLRAALAHMGLDGLLSIAQKYVNKVEAFRERSLHNHIAAPERLPTFQEDSISITLRHKYADAFAAIGGVHNFFPFLQAWAFILPDWFRKITIDPACLVEVQALPFCCGAFTPISIPVWCFSDGHKRISGVPFEKPSRLIGDFMYWCRSNDGDPASAEWFFLERYGEVFRYESDWSRNALTEAVERLAVHAINGPFPPLMGLHSPDVCTRCGYQGICWPSAAPKPGGLTLLARNF